MKTILITLIALMVSLTSAQAYQSGDGSMTGPGPGSMWGGDGDGNVPEQIQELRTEMETIRAVLKESRDALLAQLREQNATDEEIRAAILVWKEEHSTEIDALHNLAQEVRAWFRENRPNRADIDPELRHAMFQRRAQFSENTAQIYRLREQIRTMDPDSDECLELREQVQSLIQERKQSMRLKRAAEGDGGGDRRPEG